MGHSAMGASQFGSDVVLRQPHTIKSTVVDPLSGEKQTRGGRQASSAIDPKRTWTASRDSIDLGNGKAAKLGKHLFMIRFFAMPIFLNGASVPYF